MFQLALYFTLALVAQGEDEFIGDGDKAVFLRLEPANQLCQRYVPFDRRCQRVHINYKELENHPIFMFDLGLLRFYVYTHRTYTFWNIAMADFLVKIRWQEDEDFIHQNRFTLIYNRYIHVNADGRTIYGSANGPSRGMLSFIVDETFYSFNFMNVEGYMLMFQHYGPFGRAIH